ncbi:MAG TPA: metalloregulator ArsR/SmtB family transcription factor [Egicoccus sp.]|nr:metalloregulator ArsR/SmtB family transcription factor [Egicoccus sp.]HSK22470.1 metalloregulator ArsR/SmtB family transcription factor [Egicoccus sp.]
MTAAASSSAPAVLDTVGLLADPLRRRIVAMLVDEELCTCHLVAETGAAQPTVSYHLKQLREAGWVRADRVGRYTYYRLEARALADVAASLGDLAERAREVDRRRLPCD